MEIIAAQPGFYTAKAEKTQGGKIHGIRRMAVICWKLGERSELRGVTLEGVCGRDTLIEQPDGTFASAGGDYCADEINVLHHFEERGDGVLFDGLIEKLQIQAMS